MTKQLRYKLDNNGYIMICGYLDSLPYIVDKNTPFQTIDDSFNWKMNLETNEWEWYDSSWMYEQYYVRVTIPDNLILKNDMLLMLKSHVLQLVSEENAALEEIENCQVMYFIRLLPEHEAILKTFPEITIEKNETLN